MKREHYKNSFFLIFARGLNIFVSFLLLPYMVRSLSVEEYGTYGQVILVIEFFRALIAMGLASVIQLQFARNGDAVANVFKTNIIGGAILGTAAAVIIAAVGPAISGLFNNEVMYPYMVIYAITMPFYLIKETFASTHIYLGKAPTVSRNEIVINLVRVALIVISIQVFHSLQFVFISLAVLNIFSAILFYFNIPSRFTAGGKFVIPLWRDQLKLGLPIGLAAIASTAILTTDSFVVSALLSVEAFAIYKAGAMQVPFVSTLYADIATTVFPDISRNAAKNSLLEIAEIKRKSALFSALLVYPVSAFILFYHQEFITLYLSDKYAASAIIFLIYNIVLFIRITNNRDVLIAFGKTKLILIGTVVVCLMNVLMSFLLVKNIGAVGAAISSLISFYLLAIFFNVRSARLLKVSVAAIFPVRALAVIFFTSGVMALISYTINEFFPLNAFVTVFNIFAFLALTYFVLVILKVVEWNSIKGLLRNIPFSKFFFK